jgi:hypothetical protein
MQKTTKVIDYIDDHNQAKQATTDGSSSTLTTAGYRDPKWSVINQGGPYEFLTYLGQNLQIWQTKIHVTGNQNCDFESKHPGETNGRNGTFLIREPDNSIWQITGIQLVETNRSITEVNYDIYFNMTSL